METKEKKEPKPKTDATRFVEFYKAMGVPLKLKVKDGKLQILFEDNGLEQFLFTPGAGSVVWFDMEGKFAKQVFYSK